MPVTAIVLAAGMSTRYGETKLLTDIEGRPMLLRTLGAVVACGFQETIVVTGHDAERIEAQLNPEVGGCIVPPFPKIRIVRNSNYGEGMGASIAAGVKAAKLKSTGYLIVPGDMPYLTAATLIALADGSSLDRLAACRGAEGPEAPAFFGHAYRRELESLQGDRGARAVLEAHKDKVHLIVADPRELVDIDTP